MSNAIIALNADKIQKTFMTLGFSYLSTWTHTKVQKCHFRNDLYSCIIIIDINFPLQIEG